MADVSCNWENLSIYYTNLSPVYLCCSVFTALTLIFTWWFTSGSLCSHDANPLRKESSLIKENHSRTKTSQKLSEDTVSVNPQYEDSTSWDSDTKARLATAGLLRDHSTIKHIKSARQTAIEKQLTAGLSSEQLEKEREIQVSQLAAIYKLLKEKEDQFQIKSMDELQEQLRLYKDH